MTDQILPFVCLEYLVTIFPLISAPGTYKILKVLGAWLIIGWCFSKLREMNNIKCQNFVIYSFKVRMKHKSSLSTNQI